MVISRKLLILIIIAVIAVSWLAYSRYGTPGEKTAAEQVAEEAAKAENPFTSDNPLASVEVNPFEKTKKMLNPFEQ